MSFPSGMEPDFALEFDLEDVDLSQCEDVTVTFDCNGHRVNKSGEDLLIEDNNIGLYLTQEDTLIFEVGWMLTVQVNWILNNRRGGTDVTNVCKITKQLYEEILGGSVEVMTR